MKGVALLPPGQYNTDTFEVLDDYFKWTGSIVNKYLKNYFFPFNKILFEYIYIIFFQYCNSFLGLTDLQAYHTYAVVDVKGIKSSDGAIIESVKLERKYFPLCAM